MRYFEDFQVGERIELGSLTVTEEEIIAFARQFDPQPFHISRSAGEALFLRWPDRKWMAYRQSPDAPHGGMRLSTTPSV